MFPFPLSPFQEEAIQGIVDGNHVLVTAHTGSGKTLPAEFALQYFTSRGKKVVYTSPIKALSNQKYAEFTKKYPQITFGLLTGDIKTNPDAQVLIMTTEILMNALYYTKTEPKTDRLTFQIDVDDELACVVFDEVHYINDLDRGHVWEKTMLLLPEHIQMVMLSATIDAPERFAQWIEGRYSSSGSSSSRKRVVIASTTDRVVPLTHYAYLAATEGSFKHVKDKTVEAQLRANTHTLVPLLSAKGTFQDSGYRLLHTATQLFRDYQFKPVQRKFLLNNLLLFLRDRDMLPAIVFVFSRKLVETCGQEVTIPVLEDDSKVGYTVARECETILRKLPNWKEYIQLPEYLLVVQLLEKGIGIHHSGMLPILRELVEVMISKKYVKVLFATESFAIGLDCPIKTTVFTSLTKFDGNHERLLFAHEYTQMAGRAGRRGIDTVGHVVHCNNLFPLPSTTDYRTVLSGKPQTLVSKFRVSYAVVLNLVTTMTTTKASLEDCVAFVHKSMTRQEIENSMAAQHFRLAHVQEEFAAMQSGMAATLQTPMEVCRAYQEAVSDVKYAVNKKRKELTKQIAAMEDQYRTCAADARRVQTLDALEREAELLQHNLQQTHTYLERQIKDVCAVLEGRGFVVIDGQGTMTMTRPLGTVASGLAEIHPLAMAHVLTCEDTWFSSLSSEQIVAVLSCLCDVKTTTEPRSRPSDEDRAVQQYQQRIQDVYESLKREEEDRRLDTGIEYALHFDLTEWTFRWAYCVEELDCRRCLLDMNSEVGVSVGDFCKAMLKIATIAKELAAVSETHGQVECLHKLTQVDGLILKYVATCQSLYV
jgi:superfamily II RNA helicase